MNTEDSRGQGGFTRRQAVRGALAGGAILTAGGLLAACDDDSGGSESSGSPAAGRARKGGTLHLGTVGGGAKDSLDAHTANLTTADLARIYQLYEPLLMFTPAYKVEPTLAESIESNKRGDVWTVRLRDGVEFHNGKTLTAQDVRFSLARILDPKDPKSGADRISAVDLERTRPLDPRTLRIVLKQPQATFDESLIGTYTMMVPVGYDPKKPVGTGPFRLKSFTPGEESVFTRHENYWRSGEPLLDEVVITDFPDDTARINALVSGAVTCITGVPAGQVAPLEQNPKLQVLRAETGKFEPITMRVDQAPFDDVRVRQAMRLIVNREEMIQQALSGYGRVANDLYAPFDPAYAKQLPQREQDIDQAKSLLRQAGQTDLRVQLVTSPFAPGVVEAATVLAEQAKAAGVKIDVRKVDTSEFYADNYLQWTFAQDVWDVASPYLIQVAGSDLPTSPYNETHFNDSEFKGLITQARRETDDTKRHDLLHEAQRIQHERGGYIVWSFSDRIDAYSADVVGFEGSRYGLPLGNFMFRSVGFAA